MYGLPESAASEIYPFAGTGYLRRIVILRPRVVKVTPPVVSWFVTFSLSLSWISLISFTTETPSIHRRHGEVGNLGNFFLSGIASNRIRRKRILDRLFSLHSVTI